MKTVSRTINKKPKNAAGISSDNNRDSFVKQEIIPIKESDFEEVVTQRDEVINAFKYFDCGEKGFISSREYFNLLLASREFTEEEIALIIKESDLNVGDNMDYAKFYDYWKYQ